MEADPLSLDIRRIVTDSDLDGVVTGYFGNNHFKKGTIALFDKKGVKAFKK